MLIFHQWDNYNFSCDFNVKKLLYIIISVIWLCTQYSCEKPILDNPYGNDIMPGIVIDNDSLHESTIDSSSIRISWTPNIYAFEFSYYLFPVNTVYSDWNADTIAHYTFLDEGEYFFFIKSRYKEGEEKEHPDSLSFIVNAVPINSLRVYPLYTEVNRSEDFLINVFAEEVTQLTGAEIKLIYNPQFVSLDSTAEGSFLLETGGQSVAIQEHDPGLGSLVITLATYDDNAMGLTGSGSLFQILFNTLQQGYSEIIISDASQLRSDTDTVVEISKIVNGNVIIK